jgi:2OG-Fe(II) oxygenase superfamily
MIEDFIRTGKLSDREICVVLKEAEKYKKDAFTATLGGLNEKRELISYTNEDIRKSSIYFPAPQEANRTYNIIQSLIIQEYAGKKLDVAQISEIQFVHYPLGGKFDWHQDIIGMRPGEVKTRGLTFSMNLSDSDEYEGGNLTIKISEDKTMNLGREKGSWLVFPSFIRHRVDEVTKGSRNAIVVWSHLTIPEIDSMK